MNEQSIHQQRLKNQESPLGEIDATIKPSQVNNEIQYHFICILGN
jgi:hypothetical protein